MTVANTLELLDSARSGGYALGSFNVVELVHAEAIVCAAETERSPVILQISENAVKYHFDQLAPLGRACYEIACASTVPVGLHLDHATRWQLCAAALGIGFGSVMLDESRLPYAENLAATRSAAQFVHAAGASIEAELGEVGGKEGAPHTAEDRTDPGQAVEFVHQTGVDALAVAVGSSHQMVEQTAHLDHALIARLRAAVPVPLVLHGSSGVDDRDLAEAIRNGIVKVNIATLLNVAATAAIREYLGANPAVVDLRKYLKPAREAMTDTVRERLRLLGSAGRA